MSGGTNSLTSKLAKQSNVNFQGVSIGTFARNLIYKNIKENYDYEFYFVSRQRGHKFLKLWAQHYNEDYGGNLTVSEDRYWVTPSKKDYYGGCQRLIYPKDLEIPFEKGV